MGAVLGLGVGVGLLLVLWAFVVPERPSRPRRRPLEELLATAGLGATSPGTVLAVCAAAGLVTFLALLAVSRTAPVALVFAAGAGYLPVAVLKGRARRRHRELAEVWPEAVDNLASAVRAGLGLPEALGALGTRGPESLRPAFTAFALDYQVGGRFSDALDRLKERLADPVGDRVVEGLRVAREVGGGDLGRVLRGLSAFLREDLRTRSELEARQSWTVNGARLAVAAPWLVLLLMSFHGSAIRQFGTPGGVVVLVAGALACVVAYRLMVRIGRLPTERRILA